MKNFVTINKAYRKNTGFVVRTPDSESELATY